MGCVISGGASPNSSAVQTRNWLVHTSVKSRSPVIQFIQFPPGFIAQWGGLIVMCRLRRCFPKHRCGLPWPCQACGCAFDMWLGPMACNCWARQGSSNPVVPGVACLVEILCPRLFCVLRFAAPAKASIAPVWARHFLQVALAERCSAEMIKNVPRNYEWYKEPGKLDWQRNLLVLDARFVDSCILELEPSVQMLDICLWVNYRNTTWLIMLHPIFPGDLRTYSRPLQHMSAGCQETGCSCSHQNASHEGRRTHCVTLR